MNRRLALYSFLLLLLFASVACSTKPAGENTEASATSSTSGSKQVALPAGTVVTVRLSSAVGSKISAKGDHFSATVATPVQLDGKVVLPAGAEALGKVVEAVPQGRFKGAAVLRLVLESVSVNGDSYDVQTSSVSRYQKGKGKRTATFIGGGAGGGALIGGSGRRRQRRTHRRSIGCRCGNRGSGLHRGEGDCPARRVRTQLQTRRTPHHQDVAIVLRVTGFHKKAAHWAAFSSQDSITLLTVPLSL